MLPLVIKWDFPATLIAIGILVASVIVLRIIAVLLLRNWVRMATKRNEKRNESIGAKALAVLTEVQGYNPERNEARVKTVTSLIRSIVDVTLAVILVLSILGVLGIPLQPILASAGIGGVALAFGAQSLVKDYISGLFMVFEDQYGVGDVVDIGEISGTVEEVTLRITRIRQASGQVWYFRNGEILTVGNQSQGWVTQPVDIPVDYHEDPDEVIEILTRVAEEFGKDPEWESVLIETPAVWGLSAIEGQTQRFQIGVKTPPNQQWAASRALRAECLKELTKEGIKGPPLPIIEPKSLA